MDESYEFSYSPFGVAGQVVLYHSIGRENGVDLGLFVELERGSGVKALLLFAREVAL